MRLNQIADNPGAKRTGKRLGQGIGSGTGKTSGRGHKGQKARAGQSIGGFEGGQMPLHRRLPKGGFKNPFRKSYAPVNLDRLQRAVEAGRLDPKQPVTAASLTIAGVIRRVGEGVSLLGRGELKVALTLEVSRASKSAIAAVEKAGGSVKELVVRAVAEPKKPAVEPEKPAVEPKAKKKKKAAPAEQQA